MGAVATDFHDAAQAATDYIVRYRSITLNWRHFDDTWKRIKAVRRVIADLIDQIDDRAQWFKTVFLMRDLKQIYPELCTSPISVSKAINPPGCVL